VLVAAPLPTTRRPGERSGHLLGQPATVGDAGERAWETRPAPQLQLVPYQVMITDDGRPLPGSEVSRLVAMLRMATCPAELAISAC